MVIRARRCSNQINMREIKFFSIVGVLGIEPRLRAPKARVLPLYYTPILKIIIRFYLIQREPY